VGTREVMPRDTVTRGRLKADDRPHPHVWCLTYPPQGRGAVDVGVRQAPPPRQHGPGNHADTQPRSWPCWPGCNTDWRPPGRPIRPTGPRCSNRGIHLVDAHMEDRRRQSPLNNADGGADPARQNGNYSYDNSGQPIASAMRSPKEAGNGTEIAETCAGAIPSDHMILGQVITDWRQIWQT
jgi:hypothetical protein